MMMEPLQERILRVLFLPSEATRRIVVAFSLFAFVVQRYEQIIINIVRFLFLLMEDKVADARISRDVF